MSDDIKEIKIRVLSYISDDAKEAWSNHNKFLIENGFLQDCKNNNVSDKEVESGYELLMMGFLIGYETAKGRL